MCQACYVDEYGGDDLPDPPANTDQIVDLIRLLYSLPRCDMGGPLHVEIEDWNIEDDWTPYQFDPPYYSDEAMKVASEICNLMTPLTIKQRADVLATWEGWI